MSSGWKWRASRRHVVRKELPCGGLPLVAAHVPCGPMLVYDFAALAPGFVRRWRDTDSQSSDAPSFAYIADTHGVTEASSAWAQLVTRDGVDASKNEPSGMAFFRACPLAISKDLSVSCMSFSDCLVFRSYPDGALLRRIHLYDDHPYDATSTMGTFDSDKAFWFVRRRDCGEYLLSALLPDGRAIESQLPGFARFQVGFQVVATWIPGVMRLTVSCEDGVLAGCWCRVVDNRLEFVDTSVTDTAFPGSALMVCDDGAVAACRWTGSLLRLPAGIYGRQPNETEISFAGEIVDVTQLGFHEVIVSLHNRRYWHVDLVSRQATEICVSGDALSTVPIAISPRHLSWPIAERHDQLAVEFWELPEDEDFGRWSRESLTCGLVPCPPPKPLLSDDGQYIRCP